MLAYDSSLTIQRNKSKTHLARQQMVLETFYLTSVVLFTSPQCVTYLVQDVNMSNIKPI